MATTCTHCGGTGFLNIDQLNDDEIKEAENSPDFGDYVLSWMKSNKGHDVAVCDCCGNGEDSWYGVPGEHYNQEDPIGNNGPYAYNGGLCECH